MCLVEEKYHEKVENNKTKPPENVVTKADLRPLHNIWGDIFDTSVVILKAALTPAPVEIIPKIAVNDPIRIILSMW